MSKLIPLTQGQYAIVSDDDYEELNKFKWFAHWNKGTKSFYAERRLPKNELGISVHESMHRYIMDSPNGMHVDHTDRNTLDNRRCNLRICTISQNNMNRKKSSNNSSGYKGVYWNKIASKWRSHITINKKSIHLGYFHNKEEAHAAYCAASKKYHGEFGCIG